MSKNGETRLGENLLKALKRIFWINCLSFLALRLVAPAAGELKVEREASNAKSRDGRPIMNYLVGGCYNQADTAFDFLLSEIEGGITFVNFSQYGWKPKNMAQLIMQDAEQKGYAVRLLTISMGDQVARYVEQAMGDQCEICAINPCPSVAFLKTPLQLGISFVAAPVILVASVVAGWLADIPFLPTGVAPYSLALTSAQYVAMAYNTPPAVSTATKWVIVSTDDDYVRRGVTEKFFTNAKIVMIDTGHIDQHANGELYRQAYRQLMQGAPD